MRHIHLVALSAAALAATATAGAQDKKTETTRTPTARTFIYDGADMQGSRAALGVATSSTGTARDTLGLMITSITRGGAAGKGGIGGGERNSAVNGGDLSAHPPRLAGYETGKNPSRRLVCVLSQSKPGG